MKKVFCVLLLTLLIASFGVAAPQSLPEKSLTTVFTANIECLVGFSKNDVTNCLEIDEANRLQDKTVDGVLKPAVEFYFDPVNNIYYTDVFYAYCQAFSREKLEVTVSAPKLMKNIAKPGESYKKSYEIVQSTLGRPDVSGDFIPVGEKWEFTPVDPVNIKAPEPRVIMSQPIQLKCNAAGLEKDSEYQVEFKITVVSGGK